MSREAALRGLRERFRGELGRALRNEGHLSLRPAVDPVGRPRPRRALPLDADVLLARIREDAGATQIDSAGLAWLLEPAQESAVIAFARDILGESDLWSPSDTALVADQLESDAQLLFAIWTLQTDLLVDCMVAIDILITDYRRIAALRALVEIRNLERTAPERQLLHDQTRQMGRDHAPTVRRLLARLFGRSRRRPGPARFFEASYGWVVTEPLDRLNARRARLRQLSIDSAGIANPPTPEEIRQHRRLTDVEHQIPRVRETIVDQRRRISELVDERRRAGSREERQSIIADLREMREDIARNRATLRDLIDERNDLTRILRGSNAHIAAYIAAIGRGVRVENLRSDRDSILREADSLLAELTRGRLIGGGDDETARWENFERLLIEMTEARGSGSVEFLMAAIMVGYEPVTRWLDIGMESISTMGTYPGHGRTDNAVDLSAHAGVPIHVAAPDVLILPSRMMQSDSDLDVYEYDHSVIGPQVHGASNELQDVFSKIAYGLLRFRGQRSVRSDAIEEVMAREGLDMDLPPEIGGMSVDDGSIDSNPSTPLGSSDIAPDDIRDITVFNPEARRILAGLAFDNLTETHNLPREIDDERFSILMQIEREVRRHLRLPSGERVFRTSSINASSGNVDIGSLILYRPLRAALAAIRFILLRDAADPNPNGVTHRLWRLLWSLRTAGALPHRRGQATRVIHTYHAGSGDDRRTITIAVYYSHFQVLDPVSRRPGATVRRGQRLGTVGTTGNAVSAHLHLEIKVRRGEGRSERREIGSLLPHEFFGNLATPR